jgi:hypothetical protein
MPLQQSRVCALLPQVPEPGHLSLVVSPPGSPRSVISRAASGSHIATAEKAEAAGGAPRPPSASASRDGGVRLPHMHLIVYACPFMERSALCKYGLLSPPEAS